MFKFQPVLIIWQDSATDHGWMAPDAPQGDITIRTLGFLVHETKGRQGIYRVATSEDGNHVNCCIDIPKVCVLEFYEVTIQD